MVETVRPTVVRNTKILWRVLGIIIGVALLLTLIGFLTWRFGTLRYDDPQVVIIGMTNTTIAHAAIGEKL